MPSLNKGSLETTTTVPLKGVFAKNERGYRLTAMNNLTSICCVYNEKIVKNEERSVIQIGEVGTYDWDRKKIKLISKK